MHFRDSLLAFLALVALSLGGCAHPERDVSSVAAGPCFEWTQGYRSGRMIDMAARLQALEPPARAADLRRLLAIDDGRTIFVLCRMLFESASGQPCRRPLLGRAVFLDDIHREHNHWDPKSATFRNWPLEPITLWDGVPIVIVLGYELGGLPESSESYLNYCLAEGRERAERFRHLSQPEITAKLNAFLAAHPNFAEMREDILSQGGAW